MLILASASPRRQELLRKAGIEFEVDPANVDESPMEGESARACAERLAREKARAVRARRRESVVLGADTVVTVKGEILGKPVDAEDAARMLRMLAGCEHEVITGVCVAGPDREDVRSCSTRVQVAELSEGDIDGYVATGEPMDKAGAYAIQGKFSGWIPKIEGDYDNVVGLPVALVSAMLRERG